MAEGGDIETELLDPHEQVLCVASAALLVVGFCCFRGFPCLLLLLLTSVAVVALEAPHSGLSYLAKSQLNQSEGPRDQ